MASTTAVPSRMAPSTMLSGGIGWLPNAVTLKPLPAGLSSIALTALEPISRPTRDFDLPNNGMSYPEKATSGHTCNRDSSALSAEPGGKLGTTGVGPTKTGSFAQFWLRRVRERCRGIDEIVNT